MPIVARSVLRCVGRCDWETAEVWPPLETVIFRSGLPNCTRTASCPALYRDTADAPSLQLLQSAKFIIAIPSAIGLAMRSSRRQHLPLLPLLRAYVGRGLLSVDDLGRLPSLGARFRAIQTAQSQFLSETFVDGAGTDEFQAALLPFYEACVQPPLHGEVLCRRAGMVRHALAHLLRCPESLARKAVRCLAADGPYHIPGLGPAFWSALFQGLDPLRHAGWTPATVVGLHRLGLARWPAHADPGQVYQAILRAHGHLHGLEPDLTGLHIDHFLTLAALMQGRDLWSGAVRLDGTGPGLDLQALLRQERVHLPLRRRLKEQGRALEQARIALETALAGRDGPGLAAALAVADPAGARRAPLDWKTQGETLTLWIGRLWESDDPYETLTAFWHEDVLPGAGLWLPAAVLHLKDPRSFLPWSEEVRQGYDRLDDSTDLDIPTVQRYRLFNEGAAWLRERHGMHPLEVPAVLAAVVPESSTSLAPAGSIDGPARFGGFCSDTFDFLRELAQNNNRAWMANQRDRYHFAVRQPLVELCRALAARYVEPVLGGVHGWKLETRPRHGQALTSVCKNDYGRSQPYHTTLWITFYRQGQGGRREDVQFFVRLDSTGLSYGLRLGREAREAGRLLRRHVQEHAEDLFRALRQSGALGDCRFGTAEDSAPGPLGSPADLRTWAAGKSLAACKTLPPGHPLLISDELVGDILLTFDRLLPAYACAVLADPLPFLADRAGPLSGGGYSAADFRRETSLGEDWLARARSLLELKPQLILQGVPGTGKTHVAHCLARLLTQGRDEPMRLVQFHPAYTYEEFVEGIRVKSVEVNGRHDVIYPVEPGLLCASRQRPSAGPPSRTC